SSSKARAIARAPAPPVSTSVPSMSKRTSLVATLRVSGFGANVSGARTFRRRFLFEADALSFVELVEAARHRTAMKEPLLPAVVANESEPPVPNESLDRTCRHPNVSLGTNVCPKSSSYQTSFHLNFLQVSWGKLPGIEAEAWTAHKKRVRQCTKREARGRDRRRLTPDLSSGPLLLYIYRDRLTRARQRVVQVVAELQRQLVLARRQLAVEHVLAVTEVHP